MISTKAFIGFRPIARKRICNQAGLSPLLTLLTKQPAKAGQTGPDTAKSACLSALAIISVAMSGFSVPRPAAAKSRAMPRTPRQSGRLGVMPISITGSALKPNAASASSADVPISAVSGNSIMPSWSSDRPSSAAEHIIPLLSTPRILALPSTMPLDGITAPCCANIPFKPARALGAPHTNVCSPAPLRTVQTCKRSASGCGAAAMISATSKPAKAAAGSCKSSTSSPTSVNVSTMRSSGASVCKWSVSHDRVNFIRPPPIVRPFAGWTGRRSAPAHQAAKSRNVSASANQRQKRRVNPACHISA